MVLFGASGDLVGRKVAPALYNLARVQLLPEGTVVVGFGRSEFSDRAFRQHLRKNVDAFSRTGPVESGIWESLSERMFYHRGDYGDPKAFRDLGARMDALDGRFAVGGARLFYLAVPPHLTPGVLQNLAAAGLIRRRTPDREAAEGYIRVVLEKPFGRDLQSARRLNQALDGRLEESQVFRMDHYLGKETVQNIIALRFANLIFEPVWNSRYVRHVHVTVAETVGVGTRAQYFETTGALRDVMQSHVLQLLALFTMEPPASLEADAIRDEKAKLLRCLRPLAGEELECSLVRGQYGAGKIEGRQVPGYRQEQGVDARSATETFVAMRAYVDNWRWSGVPLYLATGKRLATQLTEVAIEFRQVPNVLFRAAQDLESNLFRIRIQPDEGVSLRICTKAPGVSMDIQSAQMDFPCASAYGSASPEAYERLLVDVMAGNATLFARRDEIDLAWQFAEPILDHWAAAPPPQFPNYAAGTWGPISGRDFFREDTCYSRIAGGDAGA